MLNLAWWNAFWFWKPRTIEQLKIERFVGSWGQGVTGCRVDKFRCHGFTSERVHDCTRSRVHTFTKSHVHKVTGSRGDALAGSWIRGLTCSVVRRKLTCLIGALCILLVNACLRSLGLQLLWMLQLKKCVPRSILSEIVSCIASCLSLRIY